MNASLQIQTAIPVNTDATRDDRWEVQCLGSDGNWHTISDSSQMTEQDATTLARLMSIDAEADALSKPLEICGKSVRYDKSGAGHCWIDASEHNCPPSIQEEIAAEIVDGKKESSDGERFSNGQFYRWS